MATTFDRTDADVAAVYIRTGRPELGTQRLRLAPYVLVTYPDGTSGVMPNHVDRIGNQAAQYTVQDFEVNRIEIYDSGDPHGQLNSFGIY